MSSYVVLARRYRPQKFVDLVGQEHVSGTLRNAILQNRIAHAYLFTGPRGVGKTSAARILAKAIRCLKITPEGEPCNTCEACQSVTDGNSLDVIEIDAASNTGVDNIRDLRSNVEFMAAVGKFRVYIIDEVHMLSTAAFNALLKTLEEPPPHVIFIFATTELHKVLPTIQSRCQRFDFKRIAPQVMKEKLLSICQLEGVEIDEPSVRTLVEESEGCLRDAESLLDQAISLCGKKIGIEFLSKALSLLDRGSFFAMLKCVGDHNPGEALKVCARMFAHGLDPKILLNRLVDFYSDLHYRTFTQESRVPDHERDQLMDELIAKLSKDEIIRGLDLGIKAQGSFSSAINSLIAVESLVVKLCLQRPALGAVLQDPIVMASSAASPRPIANPSPRVSERPPEKPAPSMTPTPSTQVHSTVRGILENYIRSQKPAWSPVLQSVLEINSKPVSENGGSVSVTVKSDFAGKRLASNDGIDVLKKAFGVALANVQIEASQESAVSLPAAPEDPRAKFQRKSQLAKEHDAVKAALEIFEGVISETKILDDEKKPTQTQNTLEKGFENNL
jgi:DNA polymerase-3 subunit gamma/tau